MEASLATPPAGPVGASSLMPASCPSTAVAAPGPVSASATSTTSGPPGRRLAVPVRPPVPPGMRLPYDPNGREWRKPPHPEGAVAVAGTAAEAAMSPPLVIAAGPVPVPGGGSRSAPAELPPLLGQAAAALRPRPVPPAVRAWLAPLGPAIATADWPLVSDVFHLAHTQETNGAHAVWRSWRKFAKAAGYDARPAADRDFALFICSVGGSAGWLRCMLRCNLGRVLLVPHPAAELPFVAGDEEYAYIKDWHTRLRHRPAVPFGHSLALFSFRGVEPLLSLAPVGLATASADLALEAARRSRG